MAKRKAPTKKRAAKPAKRRQPAKPTGRLKKQKRTARKTVQPRVWRRMARLADEALDALQRGNVNQVGQYLQSIRAVAVCADRQ
jgi:hypothetical protein